MTMLGTCFPSLKGLRGRLRVGGTEGVWDSGSQSTEEKAGAHGRSACLPLHVESRPPSRRRTALSKAHCPSIDCRDWRLSTARAEGDWKSLVRVPGLCEGRELEKCLQAESGITSVDLTVAPANFLLYG